MTKILCLQAIQKEFMSKLQNELNAFQFFHIDDVKDQNQLETFEIVIGNPTEELIKKMPSLKWIQSAFAGVDGILRQNIPAHIVLTNARGAFGTSIAEHMLAMILTQYKKLDAYRQQQTAHIWEDLGRENTLFHKRVLIIGAGNIGQSFARLLSVFQTTTIGIRKKTDGSLPCFDKVYALDTLSSGALKQELSQADIVALCLPNTKETCGLINYELLQHLKKDALVINVGRGNVLPTKDICMLLDKREDVHFALDVLDEEPLAKNHPLWDHKNVLITPHISGGSFGHLKETEDMIYSIIKDNLTRYQKGLPLQNIVDKQNGY